MNKQEVLDRIVRDGVIGVVRTPTQEDAAAIVDPISAGGITTIEITMTVPGGVDLIRQLASERSDLLIGAGTVLDPDTARRCVEAGAKFIVSPSTNFEMLRYCIENQIAVIPGALTPSEIVKAWQAGAELIKVFPIDSMGGANYVRTLKTVLPQIRIVASGGMSAELVPDLIRSGAEAVNSGPDLCNFVAIREGRVDEVISSAKRYQSAVQEGRGTAASSAPS